MSIIYINIILYKFSFFINFIQSFVDRTWKGCQNKIANYK